MYTHPFGCQAWYKVPEACRKKLDPKARCSILLSYLSDKKGYCLWDLQKRAVVKSRDVIFDDGIFPYGSPLMSPAAPIMCEMPWPSPLSLNHISPPRRTPTPDLPLLDICLQPRFDCCLEASIHNRPVISPPVSPPVVVKPTLPSPPVAVDPPSPPAPPLPRRSSCQTRQPDRLGNFARLAEASDETMCDDDTPKTWKQLMKSQHQKKWLAAANEEFVEITTYRHLCTVLLLYS